MLDAMRNAVRTESRRRPSLFPNRPNMHRPATITGNRLCLRRPVADTPQAMAGSGPGIEGEDRGRHDERDRVHRGAGRLSRSGRALPGDARTRRGRARPRGGGPPLRCGRLAGTCTGAGRDRPAPARGVRRRRLRAGRARDRARGNGTSALHRPLFHVFDHGGLYAAQRGRRRSGRSVSNSRGRQQHRRARTRFPVRSCTARPVDHRLRRRRAPRRYSADRPRRPRSRRAARPLAAAGDGHSASSE